MTGRSYPSHDLWDRSRHPHATLKEKIAPYLYEMQPFRASTIDVRKVASVLWKSASAIALIVRELLLLLVTFIRSVAWVKLLRKHVIVVCLVVLYFPVLAYLELSLGIGSLVVSMTVLTLIFTVGLSKSKEPRSKLGLHSAYSVFNDGCQALLGSLDGETFARQFAGGAMAAQVNAVNGVREEEERRERRNRR